MQLFYFLYVISLFMGLGSLFMSQVFLDSALVSQSSCSSIPFVFILVLLIWLGNNGRQTENKSFFLLLILPNIHCSVAFLWDFSSNDYSFLLLPLVFESFSSFLHSAVLSSFSSHYIFFFFKNLTYFKHCFLYVVSIVRRCGGGVNHPAANCSG